MERAGNLGISLAANPHAPDCAGRSGKICRLVLGREAGATSLGAVVADGEAVALALIASSGVGPGPFIIDVPVAHSVVQAWLGETGAATPRVTCAMTLGGKGVDDPAHVFALARTGTGF